MVPCFLIFLQNYYFLKTDITKSSQLRDMEALPSVFKTNFYRGEGFQNNTLVFRKRFSSHRVERWFPNIGKHKNQLECLVNMQVYPALHLEVLIWNI